jgi:hypothetical protein
VIIAVFKYAIASNEIETKEVLANSAEEAEDYVRIWAKNGTYKIQDLNIVHSYVAGEPTSFKVKCRDGDGFPLTIGWKDKNLGSSGLVKEWTELPKRIVKFKDTLVANG